ADRTVAVADRDELLAQQEHAHWVAVRAGQLVRAHSRNPGLTHQVSLAAPAPSTANRSALGSAPHVSSLTQSCWTRITYAPTSTQASGQEAWRLNHNRIGTEHLLLGLVDPGGGIAARALANVGPDLQAGRAAVEEVVAPGEALRGP